MSADTLVLRKTLRAPIEKVYAAWSQPELMSRWFFPMEDWSASVEADSRAGGAWKVEMRDPSGTLHVQHGEYRELNPPTRLVFTWTCEELEVKDSLVTVEFRARGDETDLVLTHVLRPDPRILREHEGGWTGCLARLDAFMSRRY